MQSVAARIDCRLIHGQVANLWIPKLDISRVMVIDEKSANSDLDKSGLRMATPQNVRLSVLDTKSAITNLLNDRYPSQKLLLIAKKPSVFRKLLDAGVPLEEINVGNMSQTTTSVPVTQSVNIEEEDRKEFEKLSDAGVKLVSQMVPQAPGSDFMELLCKS